MNQHLLNKDNKKQLSIINQRQQAQKSNIQKSKQSKNEQKYNNQKISKQQKKQQRQQKFMCQQCGFMITVELSQEILGLRQTIKWYQHKSQQLSNFDPNNQQQIKQLIEFTVNNNQITNSNNQITNNNTLKQINTNNQSSKQIDQQQQLRHKQIDQQQELRQLQKQLEQLQKQLQRQKERDNQINNKYKQLKRQFMKIYNKQNQTHLQYREKLHFYQSLLCKQKQLKRVQNILSKTNFIGIIYSITFQDANSYLNGQLVTHQNIWKVVQIIYFYQIKYQAYEPLVTIIWSDMQFQTLIHLQSNKNNYKLNKSSLQHHNKSQEQIMVKYIDIDCQNQQTIIGKWMPYFLIQINHLFRFITNQIQQHQNIDKHKSNKNLINESNNYNNKSSVINKSSVNSKYRLNYQITEKGQFYNLKDNLFAHTHHQFQCIIKCLLTDIDQIIKFQFYSKINKLNHQFNKLINQNQ